MICVLHASVIPVLPADILEAMPALPASTATSSAVLVSEKHCVAESMYGCLQEDPEPVKAKLEKFLESKDIPYKYGTKTKFANFRQHTLE